VQFGKTKLSMQNVRFAMKSILPAERIERLIYLIRDQKVIMDRNLAELYGVENRALKQAVKRNIDRFPSDFMFTLSDKEVNIMVSQNVIPSKSYFGGALPMVFTEQGVAMLSTVLKSKTAVQVNIDIMRTFVRLRQMLLSNKDLSRRLDELEKKYNMQFKIVFDAICQLMAPETKPKHRIGFQPGED